MAGATLAMGHPGPQLAGGGTVALPRLRAEDAWSIRAPLEPRAEERRRRVCVPTTLAQEIAPLPLRLAGPAPLRALTRDRHKPRLQMPLGARWRPSALAPHGIVRPARQTPVAEGVIGDVEAGFAPPRWHIAVAHGEARGEPDAVADHRAGKAMRCEALGAGGGKSGDLSRCAVGL